MSRPKLSVTHVYILQFVIPYEGSEIMKVCATLETAQNGRKWYKERGATGEVTWSTDPPGTDSYEGFYLITKHQVQS